jgi:RNA polymerase sigma-70 factor (ECF subfamily)
VPDHAALDLESAFAAHAAALVLYARQWLDRAAAEDAVQEAFVRLIGLPGAPDNVQAWLFKAVRNVAIDQARAGARRGARELSIARGRADWFDPRPADLIDARAAQDALHTLPIGQREVVVMRLWGQMTLAQISAVTGDSVSTVFTRYRAALDAVRKIMESTCSNKTPNHSLPARSASSSARCPD